MKNAAILLADGFEEIECLGTVDILRRAGIQVDMISMNEELIVVSARNIMVRADKNFNQMASYDMIILPGGAGAWKLRDDDRVIALLKDYDHDEKYISAICAAPMALGAAGIVEVKTVTSYPGEEIESYLNNTHYVEDEVVTDGHITTSRGPATTFAFAYRLVDLLGGDSEALKEGMLYNKYLKK